MFSTSGISLDLILLNVLRPLFCALTLGETGSGYFIRRKCLDEVGKLQIETDRPGYTIASAKSYWVCIQIVLSMLSGV